MIVVDDAVLALLDALPFTVYDGQPEGDEDRDDDEPDNIVTYQLPYAVYTSNVGDDDNPRLSGRKGRRSVFMSLKYVGLDRNQAKWAGELIRDTLQGKRITVAGYPKRWLCDLEQSQRIRRDDDAVRPDGSPLYYGVDDYALSIALTHGGI